MLVSNKNCLTSNVLNYAKRSNMVFDKQISNVWQAMFDHLAKALLTRELIGLLDWGILISHNSDKTWNKKKESKFTKF